MQMPPPNTDELLATSLAYVRAKFAFEAAIREARKAGTSDSELAHILGYSVPMLEAVAANDARSATYQLEEGGVLGELGADRHDRGRGVDPVS